jgi:hypothetical protein
MEATIPRLSSVDSIPKRTVIATVIAVGVLACCAYLAWINLQHQIRLRFAVGQIQTFEQLKESALSSSEPEEYLQAILDHYPSGTKQPHGTKLDWLVENARSNAVREIIAHLRQKTGMNMGSEPSKWIEALKQERLK